VKRQLGSWRRWAPGLHPRQPRDARFQTFYIVARAVDVVDEIRHLSRCHQVA